MTRSIDDVLRDHTPELMSIPGVVGTGRGEENGRPAILVLAARMTPEIERRVPRSMEGYPVAVRVTGDIRPIEGD